MYIVITSKCNMRCAHCGVSATSKGEDMSMEVFKAALGYAVDMGEQPYLGGGEPTMHPQFWEFIGLSMGRDFGTDIPVGLTTNGKITDIALRLAEIAKIGAIVVTLSRDQYHEAISQKVIDAFTKHPSEREFYPNDARDIRRRIADFQLSAIGRAKRLGYGVKGKCLCDGMVVKPNGDVMGCLCPNAYKAGNVLTGVDWGEYEDLLHEGYCSLQWAKKLASNKENEQLLHEMHENA